LLNHSTRAPPVELQEKVKETFPDIVPLHHKSDLADLSLVRRFIRKQDNHRDNELFKTAKHVATVFARIDVTLHEFYAVMWLGIARLYILECRHAAFMEKGMDDGTDVDDASAAADGEASAATDDDSCEIQTSDSGVASVPSAGLIEGVAQQRSERFNRSHTLERGMQAYATALPTDDVDLVITAPPKQKRRWTKAATVINMRRKLSRCPSSSSAATPEVLSPPATLGGESGGPDNQHQHDGREGDPGSLTPGSAALPPHTVAAEEPLGITSAVVDTGGRDRAETANEVLATGVSGSGLSIPALANEEEDEAPDPATCERPSASSASSAGHGDDDPLLPPARRALAADGAIAGGDSSSTPQRREEPSLRAAVYVADGDSCDGDDADDADMAPEESATAEPAARPVIDGEGQ
jgi:hypothetical protein